MAIVFEENRTSVTNPLFFLSPSAAKMREMPLETDLRRERATDGGVEPAEVSPAASRKLLSSDVDLVRRALTGEETALKALVDRLMPVVQARIARSLLRRRHGLDPAAARAQLEDLTQEVFLALFEKDSRTLRRWDPERGASLKNFVGLVAERRVISYFRRSSNAQDEEELPESLDPEDPSPRVDPERVTASRHLLRGLNDHFRAELSPLGWTLFEMLMIWQGSVREVSDELGMNPEAVRKWRTRLRAAARRWVAKQEGKGEGLG